MIDSCRGTGTPESSAPDIEISDGTFVVNAAQLGELLDIPASRVPILMRERAITSVCELEVDENEGEFRIYRNRRARLSMDPKGRIIRRSTIDFGDHPVPNALHRPGR